MQHFYPTKGRGRAIAMLLTLLSFFSFNTLFAQGPTTIVDNTPGTAFNNGSVVPGEYVGFSNGVNSSFGDVIGQFSELHIDGDNAGNLNIGLVSGGGNLNDVVVIYMDMIRNSGFSTTIGIGMTSNYSMFGLVDAKLQSNKRET